MHMQNRGFMAALVVIAVSTGLLTYQYAVWRAVVLYGDSVYHLELRIDALAQAQSCAETVSLMLAKDYFLSGEVDHAWITRDHVLHRASIRTQATVLGITSDIFEQNLDVF
jgi:hypothetical protein